MAKKTLKERLNVIGESIGIAGSIVKDEFKEATDEAVRKGKTRSKELLKRGKEDGRELMGRAEKLAKTAAQEGTRVYNEWEIEHRAAGAAVGAKAGLLLGARGGPLGAKFGTIAGGIAGAIAGPDAAKRFMKWRDKDEEAPNNADQTVEPPIVHPLDSAAVLADEPKPDEGIAEPVPPPPAPEGDTGEGPSEPHI